MALHIVFFFVASKFLVNYSLLIYEAIKILKSVEVFIFDREYLEVLFLLVLPQPNIRLCIDSLVLFTKENIQ